MIIIFGASGFIGKNLNNLFDKKKIKYVNVSLVKKKKFILIKDFTFESINKLINKYNPNTIINLHAQTDIVKSFEDLEYDYKHNVQLTVSILKSIKSLNFKVSYIYTGTVTQLGYTNMHQKIKMNVKSNPETIFDLNKQYSEDLIKLYKLKYNINAFCLRLPNVFGPGKSLSNSRGVINKIINSAYYNKKILIYGDGKFIRDFVYIDDIIQGIFLSYKFRKKLNNTFYYLTSDKGYSFLSFAKILQKVIEVKYSKKVKIVNIKWPTNSIKLDQRSFVGNNYSFTKITNWKPEKNLKKNIEKYFKTVKEI